MADHAAGTPAVTDELQLTITRLAESERRRQAAIQLLRQIGEARSRTEFLSSAVALLQQWSGCQCVGIRILNDQDPVE